MFSFMAISLIFYMTFLKSLSLKLDKGMKPNANKYMKYFQISYYLFY